MHKTNREIEVVRSIVVDKIASVAIDTEIGREIRISPDIPCEEGILIAVEILNNKSRYNTLELTSGRMAQVKQGDVIVGRVRTPQSAIRLLRPYPRTTQPGRRRAAFKSRRRTRDMRLYQSQSGSTFRLPGPRRGAGLPLPWGTDRRTGAS
ncbi:MAG: hypothetical protein CM1200mP36_02540 [Gammaproteobacteria bacterium]|nr:MAG: hypothetical protein CM1200mP36_02540 [Gammaproteobacteria bacterium]